ncbi:hypothetical protein ACO0RG_000844 [Hanseniaspora osmophila]
MSDTRVNKNVDVDGLDNTQMYEYNNTQDHSSQDTEQMDCIALDRLSTFLSSVDDKLNRLEKLLSCNGIESCGVDGISSEKIMNNGGIVTHHSGASMRKKLASNLYNRYKNKKTKIQHKKRQIIDCYKNNTPWNNTNVPNEEHLITTSNDLQKKNSQETSLANDLTTLYHFLKTAKDMRPGFTKKPHSPLHDITSPSTDIPKDNSIYSVERSESQLKLYDNSIIDKFTTIFENYYGSELDNNSADVSFSGKSMLSSNSSSATLVNEENTFLPISSSPLSSSYPTRSSTPISNNYMDILDNLKYIHDKYTMIVSNEKELSEDLLSYSTNSSTASLLDSETLVSKQNYSTFSLNESLSEIPEYSKSTLETLEKDVWTQINYHNYSKACELGQTAHLHYYQLPFPWRENKYIIHGYRFYKDWKTCLKSIFGLKPILAFPLDATCVMSNEKCKSSASASASSCAHHKTCTHGSSPYHWHNETVNIWSHLGASVYMCYLLYTFVQKTHTSLHAFQKTCCALFMIMGAFCFLCSATWHTFNGFANLKQRSRACCCDYTGISLLITTSIISLQSLILWNNRVSPKVTGSMILTIAMLGLCTVYMNWSPKFDRPESRHLRIIVFVLLAVLGNISFFLDGAAGRAHFAQLFKNSFVYYLGGVVFYGGFIPEKFRSDVHVAQEIPTHARLSTDLNILGIEKDTHFKDIVPFKKTISTTETVTYTNTNNVKENTSFNSLWWTDYYLQSHNVWHIAVVMGCLGHYKTLMDIIESL